MSRRSPTHPTAEHRRLFHRRKPPAGAPPGAVVSLTDMPVPRLSVIAYDSKNLVEASGAALVDVLPALRDSGVAWLDVQGLGSEAVLRTIASHFGLHPLVLADISNLGQRPKVDLYDDALFCVLRMAMSSTTDAVRWEQFSVVVKGNVVITFQETYGDCLDPVRQRIRQARPIIRGSGSDYLAAMVVDAIVDSYFPMVENFGELLERLEDDLVRTPTPAVLRRVYHAKRELLKVRRATWPLRDALNHVVRDAPPVIAPATVPYIRDVEDHVMQVVDIVETYRELAGSFVDVYLSSLAQRTNEVVRALTVLAAIFIPLTFLAGVYGMNFHGMPELSWEWGYPLFWLICIAVTATLLLVFRRLGWIGGGMRVPVDDHA